MPIRAALCLLMGAVALSPHRAAGRHAVAALTREHLIRALVADHVFQPGRRIVRVVHLCDIRIGADRDPVADVVEQVRGAQVPRGVQRVVLLSPDLRAIKELAYDPPAAPLFCSQSTLYFSAPVTIDNVGPQGNAVTFRLDGSFAETSSVDPNELPAPDAATIR